jgi:hypothetical protein
MEKVIRVKAAELVLDFSLYPRFRIDDYHVAEMVESLKAGAVFPPVVADSASKRLVDGWHRIRALQRLYKENAEVDVLFKKYQSDAAMYEDSMRLNSTHGRNLTSYDKAHCILRGRELGLSDDSIASALHITKDRIATLIAERWTADKEVLKRTVAHFAGQKLTEGQREFVARAGGMDQLFYINQVIALLETDSIDWNRENVRNALGKLLNLLQSKLVKV